jgi:circadian clock protein KaiC
MIAENLILLRYVELRSRLYRLISLLKIRDSAFDPTLRELLLGPDGLAIGESFSSVEALLTGFGRRIEDQLDGQDESAAAPAADA